MFKDRFDAARQLAKKLEKYKGEDGVVLAIPRGGLQTGFVIAKELKMPLDIILTKKIGYPGNEEYAIGAVSLKGRVLTSDAYVSKEYIERETKRLRKILEKRHEMYVGTREPIDLKDKIAIIVDDGIATGNTMQAAVELARESRPKKIVVAVPVAPPRGVELLKEIADEVVCINVEADFFAIAEFYENFWQVEDEEAIRLLHEANKWQLSTH